MSLTAVLENIDAAQGAESPLPAPDRPNRGDDPLGSPDPDLPGQGPDPEEPLREPDPQPQADPDRPQPVI